MKKNTIEISIFKHKNIIFMLLQHLFHLIQLICSVMCVEKVFMGLFFFMFGDLCSYIIVKTMEFIIIS